MMTRWVALLVLIAPALALQKPPDTPPAAQQQLPTAPSAQKFPQPQKTTDQPNTPRVLDRDAYTFTRYDLALNVANPPGTFSAEGKVWLRNDSHEAQRHAVLQISSTLNWESIKLGGRPAEYIVQEYTTDIDHTGAVNEAILNLPQPAAPASTLEIEVRYSGTIPQNSTRLERIGAPHETALRTDWDEITATSAFVRGIGYVVWYPVAMEAVSISEPDYERSVGYWKQREQQAAMSLKICEQHDGVKGPAVVTNGLEKGEGSGGCIGSGESRGTSGTAACGSCDLYVWNQLGFTTPAFALGEYNSSPGTAVQRLSIYRFADSAAAARTWTQAATTVEPLVHEWFGEPKQASLVVQLPDANWSPHESGSLLFTPLGTSDPKLVAVTVAHQLTHAALDSFRPWINEGAAHFAQALERERQDGRAAAIDYMQSRLPALRTAEAGQKKAAESEATQSLINASSEAFYRVKAMYCFWMLRDIVGDPALQRAFAKYNARDDHDAAYFQHLLEAESQKRLDWFFNDWVYRDRGLPDLQVSSVVPRETLPGSFVVAVTIENTGGAAAEVPIVVRSQVAESRARLLVPAHGKATTRVQIGQYPSEVTVNDGSVPETSLENNRYAVPAPKP